MSERVRGAWRDSSTAWGTVSIALHWAIVALILLAALVGLFMTELPLSATKARVYAFHKSVGITVLALMLLRIAWRLLSPRPLPLPGGPGWQRHAARATHWLLYAAALALPLSGWIYNSASDFALRWFGLVNLPAIAPADEQLKAIAHEAHEWLFWVLLALVLLHAGAALWHHLVMRDETLSRMLPAGLRSARPPKDTGS